MNTDYQIMNLNDSRQLSEIELILSSYEYNPEQVQQTQKNYLVQNLLFFCITLFSLIYVLHPQMDIQYDQIFLPTQMQQQRAHIKFKSLNTISADSIDYIVDNLQLLNRAVKYTKKQARGQYRNPTLINVKSYESCYPTVEYGQTQILLYPGYLRYLIIGHPINNRVNAPKYFNINITQCDGQELTLPQIEFGQTHKLEEYWDLYSLGVVSGSCIRKITVECVYTLLDFMELFQIQILTALVNECLY